MFISCRQFHFSSGVDTSNAAPASPLGALQPDLYRGHEGPVYINAPDDNLAFGKLHFHLKYDSHLCDLAVHLIEGTAHLIYRCAQSFNLHNCIDIDFPFSIFDYVQHKVCVQLTKAVFAIHLFAWHSVLKWIIESAKRLLHAANTNRISINTSSFRFHAINYQAKNW